MNFTRDISLKRTNKNRIRTDRVRIYCYNVSIIIWWITWAQHSTTHDTRHDTINGREIHGLSSA